MNVELLDNWNDPDYPFNNSGDKYNETWGFVHNGEEYGVIGSVEGISIFRITDDNQLEFIQFVEGAYSENNVVHRDYHDYAGYLYAVCDQGESTLQIMDLSYLPDSVEVVYDSDEIIRNTHNIFIDTLSAKLYSCNHQGMTIYSLENPIDPTFLYFHNVGIHDAYVRNDTAFLNAEFLGLFIYDFSDTDNPQLLGSLEEYEDQGYNHSGWLSEDGSTYVFVDELPNGMRMKVCDVSNLPDIDVVSFLHADMDSDDPFTIPHNLMIRNNYVYVSHYVDGLQIFDISERENPVKAGYYDTYPHEIDSVDYSLQDFFNGAWGVYALLPSGRILISDMTYGLFLLDFTDSIAGIEDHLIQHNSISVFPNPASEYIDLQLKGNDDSNDKYLYIFNMNGRLIHEQALDNQQTRIDVQSYHSGTYLYSVFDRKSHQSKSGKFIVH